MVQEHMLRAAMGAGRAMSLLAVLAMLEVQSVAPVKEMEAKADNPVGVALVAAGAAVLVAYIGYKGDIDSAVIIAGANSGGDDEERGTGGVGEGVEGAPDQVDDSGGQGDGVPDDTDGGGDTTGGESGGDTSGGETGGDSGTGASNSSSQENNDGSVVVLDHGVIEMTGVLGDPAQFMNVWESDVDPLAQKYMDRTIDVSMETLETDNGPSLGIEVGYFHDGDILKSKKSVHKFATEDDITMELGVSGPGVVLYSLESLNLSTHNEKGSVGHDSVTLTVMQDGEVLYTWQAHIDQGQLPVVDDIPKLKGVKAPYKRLQPDDLILRGAVWAFQPNYDATGHATIEISLDYSAWGERT